MTACASLAPIVRDVLARGAVAENGGFRRGRAWLVLCILMCGVFAFASAAEDHAADAVATAFMQARDAAHRPKLKSMGRNTFREKVCKQDMRFPSGLINWVEYETADPAHLPESAKRLANWPDAGKTAARYGVGVCLLGGHAHGQTKYSVVIATYESRCTSFWRIFWN